MNKSKWAVRRLVRSLVSFYPWPGPWVRITQWVPGWGKTSWRNHIYYHSVGEGAWRVDMLKKTPCGAVRSLVRCSRDTRPTASCGPLAHCGPLPRQKHSKTAFLHFSAQKSNKAGKKVERDRSFRQTEGDHIEAKIFLFQWEAVISSFGDY